MKELDHPNICRLLESFEDERLIFLVLEYCEGGELFERIVQQKYIDERVARNIVIQVASALCYAHSRNIAHRDLKPENVCFCKDDNDPMGQIKVIDWGLSGLFEGDDMMQTAVGSITYTAPEVLKRSVAYDTSCDLWSLGVLIYVVLCGKPPFWGSQQNICNRILHASYPMSGSPWDQISDDAKDLIRNLLVVDPSDRLTINGVYQHPWLINEKTQTLQPQVSNEILGNLRSYQGLTTFRSLCVSTIARHLDHHNLEKVHQMFRSLDTNGDGVLSLEEITTGFRTLFGDKVGTNEDIEKLFRSMDVGCSGSIDYTEFCAAAVDMRSGISEDVLWSAFRAFDLDDTGKISVGELARTLEAGLKMPGADTEAFRQAAEVFVAQYDLSKDNMIDFAEWKEMIRAPEINVPLTRPLSISDPDLQAPSGLSSRMGSGEKEMTSATAYEYLLNVGGLDKEKILAKDLSPE